MEGIRERFRGASGIWSHVKPSSRRPLTFFHSHPNGLRPMDPPAEFQEAIRSLRQHLKAVPISTSHHIKHPLDVLKRDVVMKEITHAVDEDCLRLRPSQWQLAMASRSHL